MKTLKMYIKQILSTSVSILVFVVLLAVPISVFSQQAPGIDWQKCIGGSNEDIAFSVIQTSDGGYAIAGYSYSKDGDVSENKGYRDAWIVKLNSSKVVEWHKSLGGNNDDEARSIVQTFDGGYAVTGYTFSPDGDFSSNHGEMDTWVAKLSPSGSIEWLKCLGGSGSEWGNSIIQTQDSGYAITGYASSNDGDVSGNHKGIDAWVIKLNSFGSIIWQKCLGGTGEDALNSIIQTTDGGLTLAGRTESTNGDVSGFHGGRGSDIWMVRLDATGNIKWQKCLGGSSSEEASTIIHTSDGGYAVAGWTNSNDGDVSGFHGFADFWIIKLDSSGGIQWQKCAGGSNFDQAVSIIETSDKGYAVEGVTYSNDGDVSGNRGETDGWLLKLNANGNFLWQECLGGTRSDWLYSIIENSAHEYIIAGYECSLDEGFSNHGGPDAWLLDLKLSSDVQSASMSNNALALSTYPNPAAKKITLGYDLPKVSAVGISVYNITGEKMQEIQRKEEEAGDHELLLDLNGFSAGSYFIKVEACGVVESTKIEVTK